MLDREARETRLKYLFFLADTMTEQREAWADNENQPGVPIEGVFWQSVEDMLAGFAVGDIPGDCRELAKAVDDLDPLWRNFTEAASRQGDDSVAPTNRVWRAMDEVARRRKKAVGPKTRKIESIKMLMEQGVGDHQIAEIYGWLTDDGAPDLEKVFDAKENPEKYEADRTQVVQSQQDRAMQQMEEKLSAMREAEQRKAEAQMAPPVPETLEQLIKQGVSMEQICEMKGVTQDDVRATCSSFGLPIPVSSADQFNSPGAFDQQRTDEQDAVLDRASNYREPAQTDTEGAAEALDPDDFDGPVIDTSAPIEEQIMVLADAGYDHKQIAELIDCTWQKARAVISKSQPTVEA